MPNIDGDSVLRMLQVAKDYPGFCFPMAGLHPTSVRPGFQEQLHRISQLFDTHSMSAVGEVGIDLYWEQTCLDLQIEAFEIQLNWALEKNLPVVIHCRDAFPEVFASVEKFIGSGLTGVFHSFSGNAAQAARICSYGSFKLGINGIVTFKNSSLVPALANVDIRYLVAETDAPYLAPVPFRGKRNEPAHVWHVVAKLAELYRIPVPEMNQLLTQNATAVFKEIYE